MFSNIFRPFHTCLDAWLFLFICSSLRGFSHGVYSFRPRNMMSKNINFKLVSLNIRGIHSFEKRKAVFNWLYKSWDDIRFLQETYSTPEVVNIWKKQWKGKTFSHMAVVTVKVQ